MDKQTFKHGAGGKKPNRYSLLKSRKKRWRCRSVPALISPPDEEQHLRISRYAQFTRPRVLGPKQGPDLTELVTNSDVVPGDA